MTKSPDAFRTISEVADWLGVQAHVLRFWESKFAHVKPVKRAGGRRYYRPTDMQLLGGIKKLLHDDGLTIKGVQKILREQGVAHVSALSQSLEETIDPSEAETAIDSAVVNFPDRKTTEKSVAPENVVTLVETPEPEPAEEPVSEVARTEEIAEKDDAPDSAGIEPTTPPREPAEEPVLPAFMHRSAPDLSPPTADTETKPEPEPVAATPARPRIVDIADPPRETKIPHSPGPLTHLARLNRLTAEQASRIAPAAQQLSDWLARVSAPGAR